MPWNLRKWLKQSPAKPRSTATRRRTWLNVEALETRYTPSFTVGPVINITRSGLDDAENAITINPTNPLNLFASSTGSGARRFSLDGGLTWGNSGFGSIFGGTTSGDDQSAWDRFGNLYNIYFAIDMLGNPRTVVGRSIDGGGTFQLVLDTGGFFDQPSIAVGDNSVWVCYDGGINQTIQGAEVTGLGQLGTWTFQDLAPGLFGQFGDIAVGPNGEVMVVYQEPTGEAPSRIFANVDSDGLGPNGLGGGIPLGSQITVTTTNVGTFDAIPAQPNRSIDAEANLAWDRSNGPHRGRVYMVYTEEVADELNDTDIFVTYSDNMGASWSPHVRVNNDQVLNGRSQFLPAIALDQTTGAIGVAWYDCRNDPFNTRVEVWMSVSTDGGVTWEPNQKVSGGRSVVDPNGGGFDFGDYNKATFNAGRFYYAWADNSNSTGNNPAGAGTAFDIYTARVTVTVPPVIPPDNTEPNDTSDMAFRLHRLSALRKFSNVAIKNKLTRLDQDWYRFRLEGTGTLTVTMTITDKTKDLDMRLWTLNSAGSLVLLRNSTTRQAGATETITLPYSGIVKKLFIQVYGFAGAESPYEITFSP